MKLGSFFKRGSGVNETQWKIKQQKLYTLLLINFVVFYVHDFFLGLCVWFI